MARSHESQSGYSPKHRIVGAIIIVSLAVIVLPRILSYQQKPPQRRPAVSPPSEMAQSRVEVLRLSSTPVMPTQEPAKRAAPPARSSATRAAKEQDARVPAPKASAKTAVGGAPKTTVGKTASTGAPKSSAKSSPVSDNMGWVVQVGTFSNDANVARLRAALKKNGFLVDLQDVELKGRKAVRVRVGPFEQKRVAMKAQSRIEKEMGLKGVVLSQR
ncbi:MAG: hypothetical protein BMS9Abin01_1819 [Gammaproteobacteria bacterium]|nr:MAG: hypothetical protein BMS9Abin01_1819 [Gammaproteobacteria bacterium]